MRGDVARTHPREAGLGLSIAKDLTELQNGQFSLYIDGDLFKAQVAFDLVEMKKENEENQNEASKEPSDEATETLTNEPDDEATETPTNESGNEATETLTNESGDEVTNGLIHKSTDDSIT